MTNGPYDVVVIGAGPAGFAAAMFAARRGLRTVIVSKDVGGQLALTDWIENYPGVDRAGGRELCNRFLTQAQRDGAEFQLGEVTNIAPPPDGRASERGWVVRTAEGNELTARTIILAFGLTPNDIGCTGEGPLKGKGVYYAAVSDAPRQEGKAVAVIGGGNSAVTAALELAPKAQHVFLVHRRTAFRAEKVLLERIGEHANIEVVAPYAVAELRGDAHVEAVALAHAETGSTREVSVDAVFVQIGYSAKTKWLDGVIALNDKREVIIDRDCRTSAAGIFAAGDLTDITYKQTAISVGEGVKAALQAFKYLQEQRGKPAVMFDWDIKH